MDFSVLILTIGIPGSGKTTWVNDYCKKHPNNVHVISTDQIRIDLTGQEQCVDPSQNPMIHDEARKRVKKILDQTKELTQKTGTWPVIIVDSTNVDVCEWIAYKELGASLMLAKVFDIKPEQALENMKNRERKVPSHIVEWKWKTLEQNRHFIPKIFNMLIYF